MQARPLVSPFNRILCGLVALAALVGFVLVPLGQDLPIHWDITGTPDGYAPAPLALLIGPGVMVFVVGLFFVMRKARLTKDFEAGRFVVDASISGLAGLSLILTVATTLVGLGQAVDMPRLIMLAVTVLFVVLGNALPKSKQNFVAGIRLPWTLRDADNWRVTHRWTGRAMVLGGLVGFVVVAIGLPTPVMFTVVMAALMLPTAIGTLVSYVHALKHGQN